MTTVFACTYVEKEVAEDDFEQGVASRRTGIMSAAANITSDSLAGLIARLNEIYALAIDDVFLGDTSGPIEWFDWSRIEDVDGDEPGAEDLAAWRRGAVTLYEAVYSFRVERREVALLTVADFKEAGIKYH